MRDRYAIEMTDEPIYSFGSVDNTRSYEREFLLDSGNPPWSKHGLRCFLNGESRGSVVLGASGGPTVIHEHSCAVLEDRCLVAVGNRMAALGLPDLALLWQAEADFAACFGLHITPDGRHVVVHGELEISKITIDGRKEWSFAGRDIFTGGCEIREGAVVIADFNCDEYRIDLESGRGKAVAAG